MTEAALNVIGCARQEALRRRLEFLGTEHILLALLAFPESNAATLLQRMGARLEHVRYELERTLTSAGDEITTWTRMPMTPRAKYALKCAAERADAAGVRLDTQYVLWGLVREDEAIAAQVLARFGVTLERLEEAMQELEGGN